jgi:phage-related protein
MTADKSWLVIRSAVDDLNAALKQAHVAYTTTGGAALTFTRALDTLQQAAADVGDEMATGVNVTKASSDAWKAAAKSVREISNTMREMEIRYKGIALASMTTGEAIKSVGAKLHSLTGSFVSNLAAVTGLSLGFKSLIDTNSTFKRSLFESERIAERYGQSLGNLKEAFRTIRLETEMSQADFANLNKSIKSLYLGIPPTAEAIAKMVKELRGRVGFNDNAINQTLESLVQLQNRIPTIMDRVQAAWAAAAKGQGNSARQMALQTRFLLKEAGASRAEIEKVMAAMEPRDSSASPFLNFEKAMAKIEQKAKDAQLALSLKLAPSLTIIANAAATVADVLTGKLPSGLANVTALTVAAAGPIAVLTSAYLGLTTAMKIANAAALTTSGRGAFGGAASRMGIGMGMVGGAISGTVNYQRRREAGDSEMRAGAYAGTQATITAISGWLGGIIGATLLKSKVGFVGGQLGGMAIGEAAGRWFLPKAGEGAGKDKPQKPTDEMEILKSNQVDMAVELANASGNFLNNYEGAAKTVQALLNNEIKTEEVRARSVKDMVEVADASQRSAMAEKLLREGLLTQKEAIKVIAGKTNDQAAATEKVKKIVESMTDVDKERYINANLVAAALDKQIKQYQRIQDLAGKITDGLSSTVMQGQEKGLFRTGYEEAMDAAVASSKAKAAAAGKELQASMLDVLAVTGKTGSLDISDFIDTKSMAPELKKSIEEAQKTIREVTPARGLLKKQRSDIGEQLAATPQDDDAGRKVLSEQLKVLDSQIAQVEKRFSEASKTITDNANALPDLSNLNGMYKDLTETLYSMSKAGLIDDTALEDALAQLGKIDTAAKKRADAELKSQETIIAKQKAHETAMISNNEVAINLSKQRIQVSERGMLGLAKSWKYTKDTVMLQERQLMLLEQQQRHVDETITNLAKQNNLKVDLDFATNDLEGFLADITNQLEKQGIVGLQQQDIVNKITAGVRERLGLEGKVLDVTADQLELTRTVREGWLEAIQGSMMGIGEMAKIIGTQKEGTAQLLRYGAPDTYKYGGLYESPEGGRERTITPTQYTALYGALAHQGKEAFGQTPLEQYSSVNRQFPYNDLGDMKARARSAYQKGGILGIAGQGRGGAPDGAGMEAIWGAATQSTEDNTLATNRLTDYLERAANGNPSGAFRDTIRHAWPPGRSGSNGGRWTPRGTEYARFADGGSVPAGSYVIRESSSRSYSDLLDSMGAGTVTGGAAGHDSVYASVGYADGGMIALTPGERILPPGMSDIGHAINAGTFALGGRIRGYNAGGTTAASSGLRLLPIDPIVEAERIKQAARMARIGSGELNVAQETLEVLRGGPKPTSALSRAVGKVANVISKVGRVADKGVGLLGKGVGLAGKGLGIFAIGSEAIHGVTQVHQAITDREAFVDRYNAWGERDWGKYLNFTETATHLVQGGIEAFGGGQDFKEERRRRAMIKYGAERLERAKVQKAERLAKEAADAHGMSLDEHKRYNEIKNSYLNRKTRSSSSLSEDKAAADQQALDYMMRVQADSAARQAGFKDRAHQNQEVNRSKNNATIAKIAALRLAATDQEAFRERVTKNRHFQKSMEELAPDQRVQFTKMMFDDKVAKDMVANNTVQSEQPKKPKHTQEEISANTKVNALMGTGRGLDRNDPNVQKELQRRGIYEGGRKYEAAASTSGSIMPGESMSPARDWSGYSDKNQASLQAMHKGDHVDPMPNMKGHDFENDFRTPGIANQDQKHLGGIVGFAGGGSVRRMRGSTGSHFGGWKGSHKPGSEHGLTGGSSHFKSWKGSHKPGSEHEITGGNSHFKSWKGSHKPGSGRGSMTGGNTYFGPNSRWRNKDGSIKPAEQIWRDLQGRNAGGIIFPQMRRFAAGGEIGGGVTLPKFMTQGISHSGGGHQTVALQLNPEVRDLLQIDSGAGKNYSSVL